MVQLVLNVINLFIHSNLVKQNEQDHSQDKNEESVSKPFDIKEKTVESEAPDENSKANPVEKDKDEENFEKETSETQPVRLISPKVNSYLA